ncbi:YneF family protein [Bacillus shivajii]|uniref:YneF family protein n=1 Tax=Bacillus shivajii TaxID=1983719 RepID=UPI001CFA65D2|nr:YneF family protein [Bacillus shivajii]UCZ51626.1 YneF family protein [Bacillus shivajii]
MSLWLSITLIVVALLAGIALGFFIARQYMMSYMKKNPPINEKMLRVMMMQMGMNPSQKKINQMMKAMQNQK